MPSSVQRKRIRKSPADRRAEIVDAAATVALTEGLECITLRRIGEELDVRPGLISHYFPAVEDLVGEAFGSAASAELDRLVPADRPDGTPVQHLARFFAHATGEAYDDISRLWINARHLSRYRPVLRDRVGTQEEAWRGRLEGLIREGVARGDFRTEDPYVTTVQILVVIDGLGAHANTDTDTSNRPPAVMRMAVAIAERELGLPSGMLTRLADELGTGPAGAPAAAGDDDLPAAGQPATPN
ncbi:TetR/AcrR family transcriptional regulator [Streptomyces sp. NPDC056227]|uniref:TetR/AcrR family transcriptional regulator n=1 Tax=Streptomyces sp. NPDC056227 TaxID=3345753 RepID=UPI0035D98EB6